MKTLKMFNILSTTFFLFNILYSVAFATEKDEKKDSSWGIIICDSDKYFIDMDMFNSKAETIIFSANNPANNSYLIVEGLPNYWKIKTTMSSRETFNIMGKANALDEYDHGIFIAAFQEKGKNPLERAREYYFIDDSDDKFLKCGSSWELVMQDKINKVNVFLSAKITFSKSWKDLKKEEKTSHLSANPYVRGEDDGWKVIYYNFETWTEDISLGRIKKVPTDNDGGEKKSPPAVDNAPPPSTPEVKQK